MAPVAGSAYPAPGTFPCVTLTPAQIRKLKDAQRELDEAKAVVAQKHEARTAVIRAVLAKGGGMREIGREIDVTHQGLRKILGPDDPK
jgi:hypothetical protein